MTACTARVRSGMIIYRRQIVDAIKLLDRVAADETETIEAGARALKTPRFSWALALAAYRASRLPRDSAQEAAARCAGAASDLREGRLPPGYEPARRVTREEVEQAARLIEQHVRATGAAELAIAAVTEYASDGLFDVEQTAAYLRLGGLPHGWEIAES